MELKKLSECSLYSIPELLDSNRRKRFYDKEKALAILDLICKFSDIEKNMLMLKTRKINIVRLRYTVYYIVYRQKCTSLQKIGDLFYQDHTTVIHGVKCIDNWLATDRDFRESFLHLLDFLCTKILIVNINKKIPDLII